ncbi:MAG: PAS domain S-box protein [Gemmataceae bacterium]
MGTARGGLPYLVAVLAVGVAVGLRLTGLIAPVEAPFVLYFPVVTLVAISSGLGPGLVTTGLSLAACVWLMPDELTPGGLALGLFGLFGVAVSGTAEVVRQRRLELYARLATHFLTQQRTAQALSQREAWLRGIFEHVSTGIAITDPEGQVQEFNPAFCALVGLAREELRGRALVTLLHAEDQATFQEGMATLRTGARYTCELETRQHRGEREVVWLRLQVVALPVSQEGPTHLLALVTNITERKHEEQRLRESETRFRTLIEDLDVGVVLQDGHDQILVNNPAAARVLGLSQEELSGVTSRDPRWKLVGADGEPLTPDQVPSVQAARTLRPVHDVIVGSTHVETGKRTWLQVSARPRLAADGSLAHVLVTLVDISDRKRAEDALRESETRFRQMAENIPGALFRFVLHADGTDAVEYISPRSASIWEVDPARVQADNSVLWQAIHPADLRGVQESVLESARSLTPWTATWRIRKANGGSKWLQGFGRPERLASGTILWNSAIFDVTEQKLVEEALRASEEMQRAILGSLTANIAVLDETGTIIGINPSWSAFLAENLGDPQRCGVGANYLAACRNVQGPDAEAARQAVEGIQAVLEGRAHSFSLEYPCPSATEARWFLLQATPLRAGGRGGVVISHWNITDRILAEQRLQEREARLHAVLDTAADAIITINRMGIMLTVNRAAESMFLYRADEMVGQNVKMLMPAPFQEDHDGYLARFDRTRTRHIIGVGREVSALRRDGTTFPVDLVVSEIEHLREFTGIIRDATRRKELEREVVEVASREQRRIGQDLHDTVGQELTALNLLVGEVSNALQMNPAEAASLVSRMARGLSRCQKELRVVIRGLLPVPVDREGLMAALADLADRTDQEGAIRCQFECPRPVAVASNLTATQLYLIAQEAVHNAVKHARPRSIRISLESDGGLVLRVRDDGRGIGTEPSAPTGLGLRIMHNRAAIIRARLQVEPHPAGGTLVTCILEREAHE